MLLLARLSFLAGLVGGHSAVEWTDETTLLQVQSDVSKIKKQPAEVEPVDEHFNDDDPDLAIDHEHFDALGVANSLAANTQVVVDLFEGLELSLDQAFAELIDGGAQEDLVAAALNKVQIALNTAEGFARQVSDEASENSMVMASKQAGSELLQTHGQDGQEYYTRRRDADSRRREYRRRHKYNGMHRR